MGVIEFLPSISISVVTTVLGFFGGFILKPLFAQAIAQKFNREIEDLKSSLRRSEEEFRAALRSRDDEITALRSTALSGFGSRSEALDKRRLEAAEHLWNAVVDRGQLKLAARTTQAIKFEVAIDAAAEQTDEGQRARTFADTLWKTLKLDEVKPSASSPDKERIFVSPLAWAKFATYRQMTSFPVAQLAAMRSGVGSGLLADPTALLDAIKAALPHYSSFIDEHGVASITYLIEDMEAEVIKEIMTSLNDSSYYEGQLESATRILAAVKKYSASLEATPTAKLGA